MGLVGGLQDCHCESSGTRDFTPREDAVPRQSRGIAKTGPYLQKNSTSEFPRRGFCSLSHRDLALQVGHCHRHSVPYAKNSTVSEGGRVCPADAVFQSAHTLGRVPSDREVSLGASIGDAGELAGLGRHYRNCVVLLCNEPIVGAFSGETVHVMTAARLVSTPAWGSRYGPAFMTVIRISRAILLSSAPHEIPTTHSSHESSPWRDLPTRTIRYSITATKRKIIA